MPYHSLRNIKQGETLEDALYRFKEEYDNIDDLDELRELSNPADDKTKLSYGSIYKNNTSDIDTLLRKYVGSDDLYGFGITAAVRKEPLESIRLEAASPILPNYSRTDASVSEDMNNSSSFVSDASNEDSADFGGNNDIGMGEKEPDSFAEAQKLQQHKDHVINSSKLLAQQKNEKGYINELNSQIKSRQYLLNETFSEEYSANKDVLSEKIFTLSAGIIAAKKLSAKFKKGELTIKDAPRINFDEQVKAVRNSQAFKNFANANGKTKWGIAQSIRDKSFGTNGDYIMSEFSANAAKSASKPMTSGAGQKKPTLSKNKNIMKK